jgi:hypothetical protein
MPTTNQRIGYYHERARKLYEAAEKDAQLLRQTSGLPYEACYQLLNPEGEEDVPAVVKKYLRTPVQKTLLDQMDLSIEELLQGGYDPTQETKVKGIFSDWNRFLGREYFK